MWVSAFVAACSAFGALAFDAAEMPGLRLDAPDLFTGSTPANFRHADLDGDGCADLVFSEVVRMQRDGRFPRAAQHPLPDAAAAADLDTWNARLYLKSPGRLRVIKWNGEGWDTELDAAVDFDYREEDAHPIDPARRRAPVRLGRFLHDLDGDSLPEVVHAVPGGLRVYRLTGEGCEAAGLLRVFPPLETVPGPAPTPWPESARRIVFPTRHMHCRLFMDGARITVLQRVRASAGGVRFKCRNWAVTVEENGFAVQPARNNAAVTTAAMPVYVAPVRLNGDDTMDFAGRAWEATAGHLLDMPTYAVRASLDGGATFAVQRARTFRPHALFVDFDGDGDRDLVTESTDLFDGGSRETMARYLNRRALRHTVCVFPQTKGRFADTPALDATVTVQLPAPPVRDTDLFPRYRGVRGGPLFDLSGDLNGDGYKDLVVQDRVDRIAVFLAAGFGFPEQPDATIAVEGVQSFGTRDIDGDGRSDIVVRRRTRMDGESERIFVYFTREDVP